MENGKLLVISGASAGAGKDTLMNMFLEKHPEWYRPPSTTTRAPRPGEVEGKDYIFVSNERFKAEADEGQFLEADFHAGNWYGTARKPVEELLAAGHNVVLRKDVNGAVSIKKSIPGAILVFIDAESFEALEARIKDRDSESASQIEQRLQLAKHELTFKDKFDHVVINKTGQQQQALEELEVIALV